jgi:Zn-dependent protease/predicted transcriptional regulator
VSGWPRAGRRAYGSRRAGPESGVGGAHTAARRPRVGTVRGVDEPLTRNDLGAPQAPGLRLAGIDVRIRTSAFVTVAVLFVVVLTDVVGGATPPVVAVLVALGTAVGFLASVLVHELAHAVAARAMGYGVKDVTVFYLGGVTRLEQEPEDPTDEVVTALAGPLVNLLLGGALLVVAAGVGGPAGVMLTFLGELNAVVGVFNLLPAHPLDGGALLRAGLTAITGDRLLAIRASARTGQGLGLVLVVGGVAGGLAWPTPGGLGLLWLAVIGMFVLGAARLGLVQAEMRERLAGVSVGDLAAPLAWVGRLDWTVSMVVARVARTQGAGVIVDEAERPVGMLTPDRLASLPTNLWEHLRLSEAMTEVLDSVDDRTPVLAVLPRFAGDRAAVMAVTRYGMPVGILSGEAILARTQGRAPRPA